MNSSTTQNWYDEKTGTDVSRPHLLDENGAPAVRSALDEYGAVLLRGGYSLADFEALTDSLMNPVVHPAAGKEREPVSGDGRTATVSKGSHAIALHRELSYAPGTPDLLAFYCERPSARGGETTLCDGVALLDRLPAEIAGFLRDNSLAWSWKASAARFRVSKAEHIPLVLAELNRLPSTKGHLSGELQGEMFHGTYTTSFLAPTGNPARDAFSNSLLITLRDNPEFAGHMQGEYTTTAALGDGGEFPLEMLRTISRHADEVTHAFVWQAGDIVVLDNSRFLHGRRPIVDEDRRILTRMGSVRLPA